MKDLKVKGTILLDYVRIIRANKDKNWDKYLIQEDMDIINGRILPSVWYPYDTFNRCGTAVLQEIAGGNLDVVRQFGKMNIDTLYEKAYKGVLEAMVSSGNVMGLIERFVQLKTTFFNFATMSYDEVSEKHAKIRINIEIDPEKILFEPYFNQLSGSFERLVEMAGGKNIKVNISEKQWEGNPDTLLDITWE